MILNFKTKFENNKKKFPNIANKQTFFKDKILSGSKIHSIREDIHNRWKPGNLIHMSTGARTKNYNQFNIDKPELQKVIMVQKISITHKPVQVFPHVIINNKDLDFNKIVILAENDGFESIFDFFNFFNKTISNYSLIHWTNFKY